MSDSPIIARWKDARSPTNVECSRKSADHLRFLAVDGLLALPRVGTGIGGLLLGDYENGLIRILDSVEIPCGHSNGPSFALSSDEVTQALELVAAERPLKVVGWYFSKTRGESVLSARDALLYQTLCPEPWKVLLLLRPSTVDLTRAVLFFRDSGGQIVSGGDRDFEPLAEPASVEEVEEEVVIAPPPPDPIPEPKPEPLVEPVLPPPPMFLTAEPAPRRHRWLVWLLAAILLSASGAAAWMTRDNWMPRPPLTLAATDHDGHLSLRWNADGVRGMNSGLLSVDDDGELHTYPLNQQLLAGGIMGYDRKSGRVTVTLRVGDTRAHASFLAPLKPVTAPPPAQ